MNNPDLISRASVLELLESEIKRISDEFSIEPIVRLGIALQLMNLSCLIESQPTETSLEKELESLPKTIEYRYLELGTNDRLKGRWFAGYNNDGAFNSDEIGFGKTPLEAVLKLKEALNSNR